MKISMAIYIHQQHTHATWGPCRAIHRPRALPEANHLRITARAAYHSQLVPLLRCRGLRPDGEAAWLLWFGAGRSRGRGENGDERGESAPLGERQHSMSAMASPPPASFAAASSITDLTQRMFLSWLAVGKPAYEAT